MLESENVEVIDLGDVTQICRLCLDATKIQPLEESPLLDHFRRISKIQLKLDGKLPRNICEQCQESLVQLKRLTRFLTHCKRSQEILEIFFKNVRSNGECRVKLLVQGENGQSLICGKVPLLPANHPPEIKTYSRAQPRILRTVHVPKIEPFQLEQKHIAQITDDTAKTVSKGLVHLPKLEPIQMEQMEISQIIDISKVLVCDETIEPIQLKQSDISQTNVKTASKGLVCDKCKMPYLDINYHRNQFPQCFDPEHQPKFKNLFRNPQKAQNIPNTLESNIKNNASRQQLLILIPTQVKSLPPASDGQIPTPTNTAEITAESTSEVPKIATEIEVNTSTPDQLGIKAEKPVAKVRKPPPKRCRPRRKRVCRFCYSLYDDWTQHKTDSPSCDPNQKTLMPQMCDDCGKMVKNLVQHKLSNICRMACIECDFVALTLKSLEEHALNTHGSYKRQCKNCKQVVESLFEHRKESPECRKPWKKERKMCERCGSLVVALSLHRRTSCLNMSCSECDFVATKSLELRRHYSEKHGSKKVLCSECNQLVPDLLIHRKDHKECQFKCKECGYSGVTRYVLKKHMLVHCMEAQYACDRCGMKFRHYGNLQRHIRVHMLGKQHKCDYCTRAFSTNFDLKSHLNTHFGLTPYKCHYCDKSFAQAAVRNIHIYYHHPDKHVKQPRVKGEATRVPQGKRVYKCKSCEKCYKTPAGLYSHNKIHTGNLYACKICDYKTNMHVNLKLHMRRHTGDKPYKCDQCPKRFAHPMYLKNHQNTHSDLKPYVCKYCGKGFNIKWGLDEHSRRHEGIKAIYKCPACHKHFADSRGRIRHVQREHREIDVATLDKRIYITSNKV